MVRLKVRFFDKEHPEAPDVLEAHSHSHLELFVGLLGRTDDELNKVERRLHHLCVGVATSEDLLFDFVRD